MALRLATLDQARAEVRVESTDTTDDAWLKDALYFFSARIEEELYDSFAPLIESRRFDAQGFHITERGTRLNLDTGLLEATTVVDGLGTTLTAFNHSTQLGDYILLHKGSHRSALKLVNGSLWTNYRLSATEAIEISGVWGNHLNYPNAWVNSQDTVQNNPLSSSDTTLTVTDDDGLDARGLTPRFSVGHLLKAESEYMEVLAKGTNTLTVRRGVQGSAAASHAQNTVLYVWTPDADITRMVVRCAAYGYGRRGHFEQMTTDGIATVRFPKDLPGDVEAMLALRKPILRISGI